MSDLSRSEKIIAEKTVCVLLVRGQNPDDKPIYAYVAVRADKLEEFMDAQKTGMFYPEDYGVIVESGEGEPDEAVKVRMEKEYGFNHEGMVNIPDATQAGTIAQKIVSAPPEDEDEPVH